MSTSAEQFADRHIGPSADDVTTMLDALGVALLAAAWGGSFLPRAVPRRTDA